MRQDLFTYSGDTTPPTHDCPVFLPGWGFDGRVTALASPPRPWLTTVRPAGPAEILAGLDQALAQFHIENVVLAGWSLGSYLALDFAAARPEKVSALYLLAGRDHWPPAEVEAIRQGLAADRNTFLRDFYRKCFLGYRQAGKDFRERLEEEYLAGLTTSLLEEGLGYLNDIWLAGQLARCAQHPFPIYRLDGARDVIAPPPATVEAGNSFHQILRHGGHALFLEKEFDPEQHLRKAAIRRKFSRAAATYDEHATVQKEAAEQLAERLPDPGPASILELGCGTGNYTRLLADRYPTARLDALDFSESMLAMAREKMRGARVAFHCRDGELFLREGRERFDLITSNATLQWFDDLGRTAELLAGRLNPGGLFLATIFGPEGLRELREGLAAVNPAPVSLPIDAFPDRQELEKAFAGHLTGVEIEEWRLLRRYPTLADLLRHIRRTGTGGPRQNTALLDRPRFAALERWFAEAYGEWCISYQVFLVKATKEP